MPKQMAAARLSDCGTRACAMRTAAPGASVIFQRPEIRLHSLFCSSILFQELWRTGQMTTWIAVGVIAGMALTVLSLGGVVWARLRGYGRVASQDADLSSGFTLARYEPLTRLLADDDTEFLRRQHNCPQMVARWKRARVRIVRLYLSDLAADFRRLHAEARALVAESPEQCSELAGVLMRQQVAFWRLMADAELRLTLSWLGLESIRLEGIAARRLVEQIAAMQMEIARTVAPLPA
jgi:hypothetical protein